MKSQSRKWKVESQVTIPVYFLPSTLPLLSTVTSARRRSSAVHAPISVRRRSSVRRWRADSPACLDFLVCRLRCGGEPLVEIRREPQIVGRVQPEHGFVQPSGRQKARQLGRGAESLTNQRDPRVDGGRRRLWRRHAAHFVQHQHAIDDRGQAAGDAITAWRRVDQPEIEGGFDVRERDDLPWKDGEHAVDDLGSDADADRAESKEQRAQSNDEYTPRCLPFALCSLPLSVSGHPSERLTK